MNYKNEDSRIREIICLGDNWENITDVELTERFDEMSELEKYAFMVSLDDEEQLDFFRKLLRGKNETIRELEAMTREVMDIAKEAQADRREDLRDWALLAYLRDYDFDGKFEAKLVKLAVKWYEKNELFVDETDHEAFMDLVKEHVERAGEDIERYHGKDAVDNFMNEVAPYLA